MMSMVDVSQEKLAQRKGNYGIDAAYVPLIFVGVGLFSLILAFVCFGPLGIPIAGIILLVNTVFQFLNAACYLYTTLRGKFIVWSQLLTSLNLRGDEQILDIGCGRGAVLFMAAQRVPEGKAVGIDIWSSKDQSGNAIEVTRQNAQLEGVAERVELHTGDMRELPFANDSFDVVLSSLAIHNIPKQEGRDQAISEALRVLKPSGIFILADIEHTQRYEQQLRAAGVKQITRQSLGWRFWYGNPWAATTVVRGQKPLE